ncbi:hypothetical protein ACFLQJ_01860 [Calditrichota bacterium]
MKGWFLKYTNTCLLVVFLMSFPGCSKKDYVDNRMNHNTTKNATKKDKQETVKYLKFHMEKAEFCLNIPESETPRFEWYEQRDSILPLLNEKIEELTKSDSASNNANTNALKNEPQQQKKIKTRGRKQLEKTYLPARRIRKRIGYFKLKNKYALYDSGAVTRSNRKLEERYFEAIDNNNNKYTLHEMEVDTSYHLKNHNKIVRAEFRKNGKALFDIWTFSFNNPFEDKRGRIFQDSWYFQYYGASKQGSRLGYHLIVDEIDLNDAYEYEESFEFHYVRGQSFYFFRKNGKFGWCYDGIEHPEEWDRIHHSACCEPAAFNPQIEAPDGPIFYVTKDGYWYFVKLILMPES